MNLVQSILCKLNNVENETSGDSLCEEVTNIALPSRDDVIVSVRITKIQTCIFWNTVLEIYGLCT